jgi:hypothetical protein
MITTQKELRKAFWEQSPCRLDYKASYRQNDYSATVRCDWRDFVEAMQRNGQISEALAFRATL